MMSATGARVDFKGAVKSVVFAREKQFVAKVLALLGKVFFHLRDEIDHLFVGLRKLGDDVDDVLICFLGF